MAQPSKRPMSLSLGQVVEEFNPTAANVVAGHILALLLFGGSLSIVWFMSKELLRARWPLPLYRENEVCWIIVGVALAFTIGLATGSVFLARYARSLSSRGFALCADGFRYREGDACDDVPWSDIEGIREIVTYERPPVLKGPAALLVPKVASYSYAIVHKSGKTFHFDGNAVKNIKRFGAKLRECAEARQLGWQVVENSI